MLKTCQFHVTHKLPQRRTYFTSIAHLIFSTTRMLTVSMRIIISLSTLANVGVGATPFLAARQTWPFSNGSVSLYSERGCPDSNVTARNVTIATFSCMNFDAPIASVRFNYHPPEITIVPWYREFDETIRYLRAYSHRVGLTCAHEPVSTYSQPNCTWQNFTGSADEKRCRSEDSENKIVSIQMMPMTP